MTCQILVAYQCAKPTGEVVAVVPADHVFSQNETLGEWLTASPANTRENWQRLFTVVKVTDKTAADIQQLNEPLLLAGAAEPTPHPSGLNRFYFAIPPVETPQFTSLNETGEVACNWATAEQFLLERF